MIRALVEARRRLSWLWRLASSAPATEFSQGATGVLWIFDTRAAPDGYPLRTLVAELARSQGVTAWSFGPRGLSCKAAYRLIRLAPIILSKDFTTAFERSYLAALEPIVAHLHPQFYLSGSFNGTFAGMLRRRFPTDQLWELQHGFVDESYFPLHAGVFFSRSGIAAQIMEQRQPGVTVIPVGVDLDPPQGLFQKFSPGSATEVHCFSKNPGGGCTVADVCALEAISARLARSLSAPLRLYLHPRDNILKLITRHRSVALAGAVLRGWLPRKAEAALVISSFSTSLATRSRSGDMLVNIQFSPILDVRATQYSWLPTVMDSDVAEPSGLVVLKRAT